MNTEGLMMFYRILIAILLASLSMTANANNGFNNAVMNVKTKQQYAVSAILKKNTQDTTVRIVQSIEKASSKEEASGMLFNRIKQEFEGYSIVDSIVSIVPEKQNECDSWI